MEVLKEYLIALGFKVDQNGWEGFNARITRAGVNIVQLSAVTVAAATQIGIAVERTARIYEELYYVSQRSGSSVASLRAYEFGAKQIGLTSEQARGSVESLASSIRMNPGLAGLLRGMGIDPNNSKNAILEVTDRLRKQYGPNGYFVAARQAGMLGIDEATFKQLWDNLDRLKEAEAGNIQRQKEAGINADEAAVKFTEFSRQLNTTYDKLGLLKDRIASDYLPLARSVLGVTDSVIDTFNRANNATDGWVGMLGGLASALVIARVALIPLLGMLGMTGLAGTLTRILGFGGVLARGALLGTVGAGATAFAYGLGLGGTANTGEKDLHGGIFPDDGRDMAVKFFMSKGWTRDQALGIAANLHSESKFNHTAVGDGGKAYGIAQWHPDRQAAFARWAGKDIRNSTLQEQLAFVNYELTQGAEMKAGNALRGTSTAGQAGAVVSKMYERPANVFAEASKRGNLAQNWSDTVLKSEGGGGSVTIAPKIETNIHGVSDPKKAADLIGKENDRTMGNMTRWGRGAIDNGAMSQ